MNLSYAVDSSTFVLNGTTINDFIEGDIIEVTPVNPVTSHVNGSGGNVIINKRTDHDVHDVKVRVLKNSDSDIFLQNELNQEAPTVLQGSLKENYTKDGTDGVDSWLLENGSFTDRPSFVSNNQDGNSTVEYTIRFRSGTRLV